MTVPCLYPDPIDDDGYPASLPDGYDEFRSSKFCSHVHCAEAADAYAVWRAFGRAMRESEGLAHADVGEDMRRLKR